MIKAAEIPYGCYWSTPFAKWQGSLQHLHSVEFAAWTCRNELERRDIAPDAIEHAILGITVIQNRTFYGLPWLTGLAGLESVGGQTLSQACATGVRAIAGACQEIGSGFADTSLVITADRTSNGAHVYYPAPAGPGGTGAHEDIVLDSFACDPLGGHSMLQTAENVAKKHDISTDEQHDVVVRRLEQYGAALADDQAFQKRYMRLPFDVPDARYRKNVASVSGDEGIFQSTAEGLAKLKPIVPDGTVTFGGQTHPADGNAAMMVTSAERAKDFSADYSIKVQALGFGQARVGLAQMPEAPVPAAQRALDSAGISIDDVTSVKTHNPFAVNDILFARQTGFPLDKMNNYGCSLIWGHPQAPTATRAIIELIEELAIAGGGYGLFTGCAAGDTGMAAVIRVSDR